MTFLVDGKGENKISNKKGASGMTEVRATGLRPNMVIIFLLPATGLGSHIYAAV